ncbi:hypothetical protein ABVT39_009071 [Epinephelus coioides]
MSAAQSQTTLESKLEALQCHFTWDLDPGRPKLLRLKDKLEDIGTEEGNSWLGHIYNLRGFIQYKLGFKEDAQRLFSKAAEAFRQMRNADEGPWLVVNYGNLAWLHHHLGEQAESQAYLSKVDAMINKYPSPSQDALHPEICAEKAWTLMKFSAELKQLAADYFEKAIRMQPGMVEWNTSHVTGLVGAFKHSETGLEADILEKMRLAKEQDPENLYLAALYLEQCAKKGDTIEDEARELARKVLRNPVSSYSGINPLLWVYRCYVSIDEAIDLAEEALKNHPDERYLKRCAAVCYIRKINTDSLPEQSMIDRAISLLETVISLYPHSSLMKKLDLANIYVMSNKDQAKAEQIYNELVNHQLLKSDVAPVYKQLIYNHYAREAKQLNHLLCGTNNKVHFTAYCHFTWDLDPSRSKLRLRDKLEDIGTEEGNSWLGHIYNLRGFIQYKLGFKEDTQSLFSKAAEAFCLDELHPEICAEKAWTLMKFSAEQKQLAADYFEKAIRMQPGMVEWNTSHVLGLVGAFKHSETGLDADILEKMRLAKEQDPENLYLAVHYLEHCAKKGDRIEDEARLLRVYRHYVSIDEAIDLAEEALENHPDERYLKRCVALCYKWKILFFRDSRPKQHMIDRAISLLKDVISLYPQPSRMKKIDLANIYAKSNYGQAQAEHIYSELLLSDLEPVDKQMIYNHYAKYLNFERQDRNGSIRYHMKAAAIPQQSYFYGNSIQALERIRDRGRNHMCGEIEEFLANLQEP